MAQPMNESQKIDVLEACWTRWGNVDLTDDQELTTLEARMHHLITSYNATDSEKIDNDLLIERFITNKRQEEAETEERFVSPNYYYGVGR